MRGFLWWTIRAGSGGISPWPRAADENRLAPSGRRRGVDAGYLGDTERLGFEHDGRHVIVTDQAVLAPVRHECPEGLLIKRRQGLPRLAAMLRFSQEPFRHRVSEKEEPVSGLPRPLPGHQFADIALGGLPPRVQERRTRSKRCRARNGHALGALFRTDPEHAGVADGQAPPLPVARKHLFEAQSYEGGRRSLGRPFPLEVVEGPPGYERGPPGGDLVNPVQHLVFRQPERRPFDERLGKQSRPLPGLEGLTRAVRDGGHG